MQKIYDINWKNGTPSAVALGYFDGVHIGHRVLINQMEEFAKANNLQKAIFTFTKNVDLGHKGKDIITLEQKLNIMEEIGVELFYAPDFSVFSGLTPREFVEKILLDSMGAKAVFCGENFLFGKQRSGNVKILKTLCGEYGIQVFIVPTIEKDGQTVSSSLIRKALETGEIEKANSLLGRPYSVEFTVVHGKSFGNTLGTPTINQIYPANMCTPKEGVYITKTTVQNNQYPSATGFGTRPTVNGQGQSCETFIQNFSGNLYGKKVKVEFFEYLFPPQKFNTTQELKEMILAVAQKSKEFFVAK